MTIYLAITLLLCFLAAFEVQYARAIRGPDPSPAPLLWEIRGKRVLTDDMRSRKCLGPAQRVYQLARQIPVSERKVALRREVFRLRVARSAGLHRCLRDPRSAIRVVFGGYAGQALEVAWCESRFSVYARNGQYLGLFQMGEYARGRYGHSWTALGQSRSAYAYFRDAGSDWSPWSCKP